MSQIQAGGVRDQCKHRVSSVSQGGRKTALFFFFCTYMQLLFCSKPWKILVYCKIKPTYCPTIVLNGAFRRKRRGRLCYKKEGVSVRGVL